MEIRYDNFIYILPAEYAIFRSPGTGVDHAIYYIGYNSRTGIFGVRHATVGHNGPDEILSENIKKGIAGDEIYTSFSNFYNSLLRLCKLQEIVDAN